MFFQVVGIADVGEHHAANPHLVEDGDFDFGLAQGAKVSTHGKGLERRIWILRTGHADLGAQRIEREASDVIDAAGEVTLEDRHPLLIPAGDETSLGLETQGEWSPKRVVVA